MDKKTKKDKFINDVNYAMRYLINDDLTISTGYKESTTHVKGFNDAIRQAAIHYKQLNRQTND